MAEVRSVAANGIQLHAELAGAGSQAPLVFLHGWLRSTDEWRFLFGPLSTVAPCVALDLPGFGRSDIPDAAYDVPFFRDTVSAALDTLGLDQVRLVGHGLGGSVAFAIALANPGRVQGVFAASPTVYPTPRRGLRTAAFTTSALGRLYFEHLLNRERVTELLLKQHYHEPLHVTDEVVDPIMAWLDRPGARLAAWKSLVTDIDTGMKDQMTALQVPSAIAWGYNDRVHPVDVGKEIERTVEKVRLRQIPNCGYQSIEDRPASIARYLCTQFNLPYPQGVADGHPTPADAQLTE